MPQYGGNADLQMGAEKGKWAVTVTLGEDSGERFGSCYFKCRLHLRSIMFCIESKIMNLDPLFFTSC